MDQLFYQNNQWNVNDLTPFANAPSAVSGSSLAAYVLPNGVQAIAFVDNNGHVDQLYYQNGMWNFSDLSSATNAPAASTGALLNASTPSQEYIRMGGNTIAVENR